MINNYQRLLHIKHHNYFCFFIIISIVIFLSIYICQKSIADYINLQAVSDGNNLLITVPISYSDTIRNAILKIKNIRMPYTITNISELQYDDTTKINYQIYTLNLNKKYQTNEIVKVTFYYNEEKIIKKLIRFIKE